MTILILAAIGILALLAELVLPGGILGVAGGICLVIASVMSYLEWGFGIGTAVTVGLFISSLVIFQLWMKYFHKLPGTRELVLSETIATGTSSPDTLDLSGRRGTALTDLAPSGRASCEGEDQRIDVVAESLAITKGSEIVYLHRNGPSWVVRSA